jgi:hypothetical protein
MGCNYMRTILIFSSPALQTDYDLILHKKCGPSLLRLRDEGFKRKMDSVSATRDTSPFLLSYSSRVLRLNFFSLVFLFSLLF